jgi:hypothetical protein
MLWCHVTSAGSYRMHVGVPAGLQGIAQSLLAVAAAAAGPHSRSCCWKCCNWPWRSSSSRGATPRQQQRPWQQGEWIGTCPHGPAQACVMYAAGHALDRGDNERNSTGCIGVHQLVVAGTGGKVHAQTLLCTAYGHMQQGLHTAGSTCRQPSRFACPSCSDLSLAAAACMRRAVSCDSSGDCLTRDSYGKWCKLVSALATK